MIPTTTRVSPGIIDQIDSPATVWAPGIAPIAPQTSGDRPYSLSIGATRGSAQAMQDAYMATGRYQITSEPYALTLEDAMIQARDRGADWLVVRDGRGDEVYRMEVKG